MTFLLVQDEVSRMFLLTSFWGRGQLVSCMTCYNMVLSPQAFPSGLVQWRGKHVIPCMTPNICSSSTCGSWQVSEHLTWKGHAEFVGHFLLFSLLFALGYPKPVSWAIFAPKVSFVGFPPCFILVGFLMAQCLKWLLYSNVYIPHPFNRSSGTEHVRRQKTKDRADRAGSRELLTWVECGCSSVNYPLLPLTSGRKQHPTYMI